MKRRPMDPRASGVVVTILGCLAVAGGCAHPGIQSGEPLPDVRETLTQLTLADGACPAARMTSDLSFLDPSSRTLSHGPLLGAESGPVDRTLGRTLPNLSQASNSMSMAWEFQQTVEANARAGLPMPDGARPGTGEVGLPHHTSAAAAEPGPGAGEIFVRWSRPYFAAGWALYFEGEITEEMRSALLDELTSWSLADPALLREYHERFLRADRKYCGGE